MRIFCKHKWEKLVEERIVSPLREALTRGGTIKGFDPSDLQDTYILVLACEKCGKLDKTVEKV